VAAGSLDNPILNGPYDPPSQHFGLGPNGPNDEIFRGRRVSESFISVPPPKKGKDKEQQVLDLDRTDERIESPHRDTHPVPSRRPTFES